MRKTRIINIEPGVKYLGESNEIKELPSNCIFDKGKVGCGGTTLAIDSGKPYVIAVPFVSLIENKTAQHPNILGVYGNMSQASIKEYVGSNKNPVIMTTYDSIEKVTKAINNPSDYYLLVDEYHLLFMQYSFREGAVAKVLSNFRLYKEFCFMTATQLEEEFILDELSDIDVVVAKWQDITEISVFSVNCTKGVLNSTIDVINNYLDGSEEGNLYVFVNSVEFIKDIVANTALNSNNCNVVYSKNNRTDVGIERGVLPCRKDGSIKPKKINLLTSTVFEGSDIYDRDGKILMVSDSSKAHTLIDISTSFQQIAGRIRTSRFIGEIAHFYTTTRYTSLDFDAFKKLSLKEEALAKKSESEFNNLSEDVRTYILEGNKTFNETYISVVGNSIKFNANLVKLDLYNFKICKHLYKVRVNNVSNLDSELTKYHYTVKNYTHESATKISPSDVTSFTEVVTELEKFYQPNNIFIVYTGEQEALLNAAFTKYPFLKKALLHFGYAGIKELNYVQTNIKRKLLTALDTNTETKVYKMLKTYNDITAGSFIPASILKKRFKTIYDELGMTSPAKGSDIENYFHTKSGSKRVGGKKVAGYTILNPKFIINKTN